jgi:hypothetical protein
VRRRRLAAVRFRSAIGLQLREVRNRERAHHEGGRASHVRLVRSCCFSA